MLLSFFGIIEVQINFMEYTYSTLLKPFATHMFDMKVTGLVLLTVSMTYTTTTAIWAASASVMMLPLADQVNTCNKFFFHVFFSQFFLPPPQSARGCR